MNELQTCQGCLSHTGIEERIRASCIKIDALEKVVGAQLRAQKEALDLARLEMDRRLEEMNQFRAQLTLQAGTFITNKEVGILMEKMEEKFRLTISPISEKIRGFENLKLRDEGALGIKTVVAAAVISVLTFLVAHWIYKF